MTFHLSIIGRSFSLAYPTLGKRGATMVEYALLISLVAGVTAISLELLGVKVACMFCDVLAGFDADGGASCDEC